MVVPPGITTIELLLEKTADILVVANGTNIGMLCSFHLTACKPSSNHNSCYQITRLALTHKGSNDATRQHCGESPFCVQDAFATGTSIKSIQGKLPSVKIEPSD